MPRKKASKKAKTSPMEAHPSADSGDTISPFTADEPNLDIDISTLEADLDSRLNQHTPLVSKQRLPVPRELKIARRQLKHPVAHEETLLVKPKSQYHHGDLARALIDAAILMIAELGSKALTLRSVAKKVGVSPAAPYRHFTDKEALLAAVAEEGYLKLIGYMEKALENTQVLAVEKLVLLGGAYIEFAEQHQAHFRVMFGPEIENKPQYPDLQQATTYAFGLVVKTILEAHQQHELKQASAEIMALAFWSMIHGFASLYIDGQIEPATLNGLTSKQMGYLLTRLLTTPIRP